MEFRQTREYNTFDLSYTLIYDLNESDKTISGTLIVDAGDSWDMLQSPPSYEFTDDFQGTLEAVTTEKHNFKYKIEFNYTDTHAFGKLLLDIVDINDQQEETLHIKFPSAYLLRLYERLLQEEVPVQAHQQLGNILHKDQLDINLDDLTNSAPYAVTRSEYFKIINKISSYDSSLSSHLKNIIITEFTDWIRGKSSGKYYDISSITELQELVQEYNTYQHTPSVQRPILDTIICDRREHIGRGLDGFLIGNFGDRDFPYYDLSLRSFVLAIGYLAQEHSVDNLAEHLTSHTESGDVVGDIGDCLEKNGENRINCFRSQLPASANKRNIEPVRYGIARLIRSYLIAIDDSLTHSTKGYLYGSIVSICANTPAAWLAEHARHHRHLELAEEARESDPDRALKHYDQGIVVLTQANSWDPTTNEHVWVVFRKTLHEAEMLEKDGLYDEAANMLAEREKLIQKIGESSADSLTDEIINQLNGHQNELRADKYLKQDQLERARKFYNQAAGYYRKAGREKLFKGVKGRELQIDALVAEISGDFKSAADLHQQYAETLPYSAGSKFHRIRHDICMAKSAAMEQDYGQAIERLTRIEPKYNTTLDPSQQQFKQLLQAAQHFRQDEIDEIEGHLQSLISSLGDEDERLLNFSDNYTTGHLTVLAAQRLLSLPVEKQTLADIIDLAIKDSCFPKAPEDRINGITEIYASPTVGESQEWELSLPSHIINGLDQLRIDKQTTFDEYSSLVRQLGVITEQLLLILWEYHAKQYWSSEWKSQAPGTSPPTIGDLYQFFKSEAGASLNAADNVIRLFEAEIVGEKLIKELRDALAHGRDPNVTNEPYRQINESQFEQIYEAVTDVFRVITTDLPVLGVVDSQLSMNTYKISLKWGGLPKRLWITTECELETDELYFFPRTEFDKDYEKTVVITAETIEPCESDIRTHFLQE